MALPAGITTCVVTAGAPLDFAGQGGTITLTVTPVLGGNATNIVWQATGQPLVNFPMTATADATEQAQVVIPHSNQAGFVDGSGNGFTGWSYKAQIVFKGANRQQVAWTKVFQIPSGQAQIDLDLVPDGSITSPTVAPVETVTSVNGETGAVTVETSALPDTTGATTGDALVLDATKTATWGPAGLTSAQIAAQVGDAGTQVGAALAGAYASTAAGIDIRSVGCVADEQSAVCDMPSGSDLLTRTAGEWTAADVGKVLSVPGGQAAPDALGRNTMPAKIIALVSAAQVQLDRTAAADITGATVLYATDNAATLQALFDELSSAGGGTVIVPDVGKPFWTDMVMPKSNTTLLGPGEVKQTPRNWNDPGTSAHNGGTIMPWTGYGTTDTTENVHIRGLRVNGNKGSHYGSIATRTNGEGINFKYCKNCSAENNTIWDVDGDGIDFDYTTGSRAVGNKITNASGWGIHHSSGNKNNVLAFNHVTLCGWDQVTDSGQVCGGMDCSLDSTDVTYIGNIADGCYINYSIGGNTGYDPAVYRLIAVGNRSLPDAATPALPDLFGGVIFVTPQTTWADPVTFNQTVTVNAEEVLNAQLFIQRTDANSSALTAQQNGDPQQRYSVRASGATYWSDGTNPADVALYRSGANELALSTGDTLRLAGGGWNTGNLRMGNYRLWVDATGALRIKNGAPTSDTDGATVGSQT